MYRNWHLMYRSWLHRKPMYRNCMYLNWHVPKATYPSRCLCCLSRCLKILREVADTVYCHPINSILSEKKCWRRSLLNLLFEILYEWPLVRLLVSRVNIDSKGMPDNPFSILSTSVKSARILSSKAHRCSDFNRSACTYCIRCSVPHMSETNLEQWSGFQATDEYSVVNRVERCR